MRTSPWALLLPALATTTAATAQTLVPNDLVFDNAFVTGVSGAVGAEFLPDGRLVIIRQNGNIRVRPAAGGALVDAGTIPVNISSERGLLGIAVDPQFTTSNRLYFYYSEGNNADDRHRVAWATIDPNTSVVDVANRTVILRGMYGPANHNGGGITFGPDGNLYVGVGDTGCNCNCAPGRADNWFPTCLTNLNGKILRVDRDGGIPPTNPLVGVASVPACGPAQNASSRPENSMTNGCNAPFYQSRVDAPRTEIYNWGFRNPWRFSFDPLPPHHLWIGDVGEVTWEEITISTGPGQHHGWPFREGTAGDPRSSCSTATPQATGDCVEPAFQYAHNGGAGSVSGGVFSTHCSWPADYQGRYWFADYTTDQRAVWTVVPNATRDGVVPNSRQDILTNLEGIVHFTTGPDGAIYLVNANAGRVQRVGPANPVVCNPDAGVPDTGPTDTGVHPDAAPGPMDAAAPADTGVHPDAMATADDAGATADDAAPGPIDAAPGAPDAAATGADAASPAGADASATADAGGLAPADDGCGCASASGASATGAAATALAGLLVLGLMRRRRRR